MPLVAPSFFSLSSDIAITVRHHAVIAPEDNVRQQRVVDVLNACTAAKIANVTFAVGDADEEDY